MYIMHMCIHCIHTTYHITDCDYDCVSIYCLLMFIADSVCNITIITYKSDDTTDTITGHRWSPAIPNSWP